MKANGFVFRTKAQLAAEDLLEDVYIMAKDSEATLPQKLDALKTFAKLGELEPKPDKSAAAGGGFSITINLGDKTLTLSQEKVVEGEVLE